MPKDPRIKKVLVIGSGPMGLAELCTYKYIVHGNGQVRGGSSAKMSCYTNK